MRPILEVVRQEREQRELAIARYNAWSASMERERKTKRNIGAALMVIAIGLAALAISSCEKGEKWVEYARLTVQPHQCSTAVVPSGSRMSITSYACFGGIYVALGSDCATTRDLRLSAAGREHVEFTTFAQGPDRVGIWNDCDDTSLVRIYRWVAP